MRDFGLSLALFGMILNATGVDRLILRGPDRSLLCSTYSIIRAQGGAGKPRPAKDFPGDEQPSSLCPHGVLCNFRRMLPEA